MTKTDRGGLTATLPPAESPLMPFEEAARLLSMKLDTLRRTLDRPTDPLCIALKPFLVTLSERRRYFKRREFMAWLDAKCA